MLKSSSTKFLVVLFFIAFYTTPFSSKHFFLGLFVRCLSTQLFFLVVLPLLLLCMKAFSSVGLLSLFWVRLFHAVFPEPSSTQLLSWVVVFGAVCRAQIRSVDSFFSADLVFSVPVFRGSVLSNLQDCFEIFSSFFRFCSKTFLSLVVLLDSGVQKAHLSSYSQAYFVGLLLPRFTSCFCSF